MNIDCIITDRVCRGCDSPKIENYETMLCASCSHSIRKAEKKALAEPKKRKRIKPVGEKKAAEIVIYKPKRLGYLEEHPYCEIKLIGCIGIATQLHHVTTSAKDFTNMDTVKAACWRCHFQVESVLSAAVRRKLGLLRD